MKITVRQREAERAMKKFYRISLHVLKVDPSQDDTQRLQVENDRRVPLQDIPDTGSILPMVTLSPITM